MKALFLILLALFPSAAFAQASLGPLFGTINQIQSVVTALIPLLSSLAVLMFMWGLVKFIANIGDESARAAGKHLMIWGMVALFVMVGFWSIIGYVQQSLGLSGSVTPGIAPMMGNPVPMTS